jgi:hypothetical protein
MREDMKEATSLLSYLLQHPGQGAAENASSTGEQG